jgi:rod shape-determining protein MreD
MKGIIKTILLAAFFYFLAILQMSYLPFIAPFNLIVILVLLINLLEDPKEKLGTFSAVIAGIIIDIYSSGYLGFMALSLFFASIVLKYILSRYVRIPSLPWLPKI